MLITSKNRYHALNEQYFEFKLDHEKEKLTLNDDNDQKDITLEICIQRSL